MVLVKASIIANENLIRDLETYSSNLRQIGELGESTENWDSGSAAITLQQLSKIRMQLKSH